MLLKQFLATTLTAGCLFGAIGFAPDAQASCWHDRNGRAHCNAGNHYGQRRWSADHRYYSDNGGRGWFDTKTGKIVKGGLWGAGIGAGAGYLLGKPVGRTAVLGAGIGAGAQATRYSSYMHRHPVVKTATYGALAGAGASQLFRETSPVKGALWGAAIGTGVGAIRHMDY